MSSTTMTTTSDKPLKYPSTFYRVSIKVLVFDHQGRLLVIQNTRDNWEMPGGGLEHDEPPALCIRRELQEEAGIDVEVGKFRFMFQKYSPSGGYQALRLVFDGRMLSSGQPLKPGPDMHDVRFMTREEFLQLRFSSSEAPIQDHADEIWP